MEQLRKDEPHHVSSVWTGVLSFNPECELVHRYSTFHKIDRRSILLASGFFVLSSHLLPRLSTLLHYSTIATRIKPGAQSYAGIRSGDANLVTTAGPPPHVLIIVLTILTCKSWLNWILWTPCYYTLWKRRRRLAAPRWELHLPQSQQNKIIRENGAGMDFETIGIIRLLDRLKNTWETLLKRNDLNPMEVIIIPINTA